MSTVSGYSRLPYGVGKLLDDAIARTWRLRLWGGLAITGTVLILGIVAVMVVDSRFVIFDDRIRVAMTAGVALLTLLTALFAVLLPLRRRIDLVKMARRIDALHPEFEERISTLVELAGSDPSRAGFSASLYALVGNLAEGDIVKVDFARDFPSRVTKRLVGVFLALFLILLGGIVASPDLVGRLCLRAVAPWIDIGNLFAKNITVKPGDMVVLSGSVIRIEATPANPKPETRNQEPGTFSIRLSRKTRHGWSEETTEELPNGVYETTADINEREWRYRIVAGPAVTRYYYVRVSQMPKYDSFTATVCYPSYTQLAPLVVSNADVGAIKAIQGSRVKFGIAISDPGTMCDFRIGTSPVFEHTMVSNRSTTWSLDLVNSDGFRAEKGRGPLTSFVDQPPSVVIERPTGTLRLPPHAKIPVEITASDDVGVSAVYFRVSIDGEPWERHHRARMKAPANKPFYRAVADIDLALYDLIFAKQISFDVVAEDACPPEFGGPHAVTSTPFTVQFNANESNYAQQELRQEMILAQRDIDEARRRLGDAKSLAQQVRDELNRNSKVAESTEQKSERLAHEISEAEKRIDELKNAFMEDERFASLTRPLERILDETLKPALEKVENAQFREREERAKEMDEAIPEMAKAFDALDDLTKQLKERGDKVEAFEKAKDLAARQEALARSAKEILAEKPTDTAKLEAWKQFEEAALRKADEFARSKPDSEFSEAKRKMETAVREMSELRKEIDAAKAAAEQEKRDAAAREQREKAEAARVAQELTAAAADQQRAAEAMERKDAPNANQNQRSTEEHLKRAEALPAVKALQKFATEATKKAEEVGEATKKAGEVGEATSPSLEKKESSAVQPPTSNLQPPSLRDLAKAAQQDAAEALTRERELRDAIAKGEKKPEALQKLDDTLRKDLAKKAADLESAVQAARDQALARAADAQQRAAEAQAKNDAKATETAQREAEAALAQGKATPAVAEMQKLATAATKKAEEVGEATSPSLEKKESSAVQPPTSNLQPPSLRDLAKAAQKDAAEALTRERALREAIAKGEKTAADLDAFEKKLGEELKKRSAQAAQAAEAARAAAERQRVAEKTEADKKAAKEAALNKELSAAEAAQAKAGEALHAAAEKRAQERAQRRAGKPEEAAAISKQASELERQAGEAQKTAADALKRGEATEGTQALQKLANDTAADARKASRTAAKAAAAEAAQEAATSALREEKALREAIAKGEKTEADLEAMNRAYRQLAADKEAERAAKAADEARRQRDETSNAQKQAQELATAGREQAWAEQLLKLAEQKRADERKFRADNNTQAADSRAKEAERFETQAAEAQRSVGDRLERAPAMPAVRALQQLAADAARNARKAPRTAEKAQAALDAQKAATAALKRENDIREGMRKGERTDDDLAALQDELNAGLEKLASERTAAARQAADAALAKAREAIGEKEGAELNQLADAALAARQDAVEAELAESQLQGNAARSEALDDAESDLDAARTTDAEATAREDRIRAMQKSALEALERNDRSRAVNLQKDIARAQSRAADATEKDSDAAEARSEANAAQEAAAEATQAAARKWNDETKAKAIAAQKAAMESEAAAAEEARAARSLEKIAAAEPTPTEEKAPTGEATSPSLEKENDSTSTSQPQPPPAPAAAARQAADAMNREVKAQAAALGMSRQKSAEACDRKGEKSEADDEKKGGGGAGDVDDEVKALAKELKRRDNPDFFKSLFTRQGWFKIRGISKDGLGVGDLKDVPPEYRDLVRRYFLKLTEEKP